MRTSTSLFRRYAAVEEAMIRAAMPTVSAGDTARLTPYADGSTAPAQFVRVPATKTLTYRLGQRAS